MLVVFYAAGIGIIAPFKGADFQSGRYIANATCFGVILSSIGFYWLIISISKSNLSAARIAAILITSIFMYNSYVEQKWMIGNYASNVRSINLLQVELGKWLNTNTLENDVIATNDIGAIGYFSKRRVIDLIGLINPQIIDYHKRNADRKRAILAYLGDVKPDYIVVFPLWYPYLIERYGDNIIKSSNVSLNTASEWDFKAQVESIAGILLRNIRLEPIPSELVVIKRR